MRWYVLLILAVLVGCASDNSSQKVQPNEIPAAVQAAFDSEHPYAKMNNPTKVSNEDGSTSFKIPYTRPDGTTGTATYAQMGELLSDN